MYERTNPLYQTLLEIGALWTATSIGYYTVLPLFGISLSYNDSPIALSVYYLVWLGIGVYWFWDLFDDHLPSETYLWRYLWLSGAFGSATAIGLYLLAQMPALQVDGLAPVGGILSATPWFFLPKAAEVLVQQMLITALTFSLASTLRSLKEVIIAFAITFGGAHVVLFLLSHTPTAFAVTYTSAAILSATVFPLLILRVRGGLVLSYTIHICFYLGLVFYLHTLPPIHPFH